MLPAYRMSLVTFPLLGHTTLYTLTSAYKFALALSAFH